MPTGSKWVAPINRLAILAASVLLLAACAQSGSVAQSGERDWQTELLRDHPLVGRIWNSHEARFVSETELWSAVDDARYLLLGEKHDNPDHHALQLQLLAGLLQANAVAGVVFEMLDREADAALATLNQQEFDSSEEIRDYLRWDVEGWDWKFYGPLVDAAYSRRVPIFSGNISGADVGQIYGADPAEYPHLASVFDAPTMAQLNRDIDESHCGMLPESQFPAMLRVQQQRDFTMASAMRDAATDEAVVLIAGNYHVRQDLGVPNYLLQGDQSLTRGDILSLAFLEVQEGIVDAEEYLQRFSDIPAYDYIWFTPALTSEDYCASLRGAQASLPVNVQARD